MQTGKESLGVSSNTTSFSHLANRTGTGRKFLFIRLRDILMKNVESKGFHYIITLLIHLTAAYMLFLYSVFLMFYKTLKSYYFTNYILSNPNCIYLCQCLALYFFPWTTVSFHMSFHSYLMVMEDLFYSLKINTINSKSLFHFSKVLRRSSIFLGKTIGRGIGDGLGGMGEPPQGNWRRLVVWTGIATAIIATNTATNMYRINQQKKVDMHKTKTDAQTARYSIDTQAETTRYSTDTHAQTARYSTDKAWENYREDKKTWDSKSIWTRGKPPQPPQAY